MHFSVAICVAALCLVQAAKANYYWWSVGVGPLSEQPDISTAQVDCDSLTASGVLRTEHEIDYCKNNKAIIQLIALGTRAGIIQCQKMFDSYQWNCTTFQGDHLFGLFVNKGTKETAFLNALLPLTAGIEIAKECRQENIPDCTCSIKGVNGNYEGVSKTYSCDDDPAFAKKALNDFLNDTEELTTDATAKRRTEIHNHNTGLKKFQERNETCRCSGVSGSCTVKSCYFKSPDVEEMQNELKDLYLSSVKVKLNSQQNDIVPVNSKAQFDDDRLGYVTDSPSFCESNTTEGVIGSEHRECKVDNTSPDRCSVLCCNRGYYTTSETMIERSCQFVYCCRVECEEKEVVIQRHYCNGKSGS